MLIENSTKINIKFTKIWHIFASNKRKLLNETILIFFKIEKPVHTQKVNEPAVTMRENDVMVEFRTIKISTHIQIHFEHTHTHHTTSFQVLTSLKLERSIESNCVKNTKKNYIYLHKITLYE